MPDSFGSCCSRCHGNHDERRWLRGAVYLAVYFLAFMPCLAVLFMSIEGPIEADEKAALRVARAAFLANHSCLTDGQVEQFLAVVIAANNRGVSALRNASAGRSNWNFGQALFFATTVVTTIGYGRTTPLSHLGKGMCIIVALVGIPLTLLAFTLCAGWLRRLSRRLHAALQDRMPPGRQPLSHVIHLCLVFLILLVCFLIIPAAAFVSMEPDWTYLDAFYYCVISLTTVGLGDFIVGEHPDQEASRTVYKISAVIYLYVGLVFVVFALRSFADVPTLNPGRFIYSEGEGEDNEGAKLISPIGGGGARYTSDTTAGEDGGSAALK